MNNINKNVLTLTIGELLENNSKSNELNGLISIKQWFYETYYGAKNPYLDQLETLAISLDIKALGGEYWHNLSHSLESEIWVRKTIRFFEEESEKGIIVIVSDFYDFPDFTKGRYKNHTFVLIQKA